MPYCAYCGSHTPEVSYRPCPSCGKPTNGAPATAAVAPSGSNPGMMVLWIILGVFGVLAVIGILAAIAIPNLLTAQHRSRQKRTIAEIRTLSTALEAYATDNDQYPEAENVAALQAVLQPTYAREMPILDGWNHGMRYECWQTEEPCDSYAIGSGGKDGVFEHESLREYASGTATRDFDCDLVFANGNFVQYPEGAQTGGN